MIGLLSVGGVMGMMGRQGRMRVGRVNALHAWVLLLLLLLLSAMLVEHVDILLLLLLVARLALLLALSMPPIGLYALDVRQKLAGHGRVLDDVVVVLEIHLMSGGGCLLRLQSCILLLASNILRGYFARLVHEAQTPVVGRGQHRRLLALRVDEVESHASFAFSGRLAAVEANRHSLITLQVPLTAGKTTRSDSLGFACGGGDASACRRLSLSIFCSHCFILLLGTGIGRGFAGRGLHTLVWSWGRLRFGRRKGRGKGIRIAREGRLVKDLLLKVDPRQRIAQVVVVVQRHDGRETRWGGGGGWW